MLPNLYPGTLFQEDKNPIGLITFIPVSQVAFIDTQ